MKKITTTILDRNGDEKEIYIFVDNKTAHILDSLKDSEIYRQYILDVYKSQWGNYRENNRNTSLEQSIEENGFDLPDEVNVAELFEEKERIEEVRQAIAKLNKEQRWIIEQLYYKGRKAVPAFVFE